MNPTEQLKRSIETGTDIPNQADVFIGQGLLKFLSAPFHAFVRAKQTFIENLRLARHQLARERQSARARRNLKLHQLPIRPLPIFLRGACVLMIPIMLLTSVPLQAWEAAETFGLGLSSKDKSQDPRFATPKPVKTRTGIKVNRTAPDVTPPSLQPQFGTGKVTDEEIFRARVFEEPLVPIGGATTPEENEALSKAIQEYQSKGGGENVQPFMDFLHEHPATPWRTSLLTDLGIVFRKTGYFSKALTFWEQAWNNSKDDRDPKAMAVVNCALGHFLELSSRLGRLDKLKSLLEEVKDRPVGGSAGEKVAVAHEAVWQMENRPEDSFRCGPMALNQILKAEDPRKVNNPKILACKSTLEGISMDKVTALANSVGMNYQMAKRVPGSKIIVPSVVNWKAGHYAALVREQNGRFLVQDPTFTDDIWITQQALDEEASGYFIVPKGSLPSGWQSVSPEEGKKVWGKGYVSGVRQDAYRDTDVKCKNRECSNGMAVYNFHAGVVSLNIQDTPVGYLPPLGPSVYLHLTYNHREVYQPAIFTYSNFGPKWTFDWMAYVTDDPTSPSSDAYVYLPGGGRETYTGYNGGSDTYATHLESRAVLHRTSSTSLERIMPDGSKQIFDQPDGEITFPRKIFLTKEVDPAGNAITYAYDGSFRLTSITDAIGQVTTFTYGLGGDNLKITRVTDPFGRHADFEYHAGGQLKKITDVVGITSEFTYDGSDFIITMTTPYGTTTFQNGTGSGQQRWIEATDPLGEKERVEFRNGGLNFSDPIAPSGYDNTYLNYRNSYFWDKKAMEEAPGDYTKAKVYHWLHDVDTNQASSIKESEKNPLENRIWYKYAGQSNTKFLGSTTMGKPQEIARILDDGTTQRYQFEYNDYGKVTKTIDPVGRTNTFSYATNGIDLVQVRGSGTNDLLATFTYNSAHQPLTSTDVSGQTTTFTYTTNGLLQTITNAKSETTTFAYNTNSYLTSITGALTNAVTSFTYDSYGRVRTVTDSEGYTITTDYDDLDRPTLVTYPDGSTEQIAYDKLDPAQTKDRLNRWSRTIYDAIRRPVAIHDSLGRLTQLEWCGCGALEAIRDPIGRVTSWTRDLEGRPTAKIYPDSTIITYNYEATTSRVKSTTDAKNQKTSFTYFADNSLKQVSYAGVTNTTPSVSYTYSTNYNRVATMTDGTGTTTYNYNAVVSGNQLGEGRLASIDGPFSNDTINFTYDELGRVISRSIGSSTNTVSYDSLGRATNVINSLGSFTYSYTNTTARLSSVVYPNGQTNSFDYYNNSGDQRLKTIHNKNNTGSTISKFDYEYNVEGQISKWTQQADASTPTVHEFQYDYADQLTSAVLKNQSSGALIKRYAYVYDTAGNRTGEQIDDTPTKATFNDGNQMTANQSSGSLKFKGSINETGMVTVAGISATMSSGTGTTNNFTATVPSTVGTNIFAVVAQDYSTNLSTNRYEVVVANTLNQTLTYDSNGNLTSDGTRTYDWDGMDRLVKITSGTHTTEFTYDGLSRRVRIVEKDNGSVSSDKRFLWIGTEIAEERDSTGASVNKRFEAQGVQDNGTPYFYNRDHLGSIRELVDSSNTVRARYSYDPYGRATKITGDKDADFLYTGHYLHSPTGLYLALYRAYDSTLGRWLNRDPVSETGGLNLYAYVGNNPINVIDRLGLIWGMDWLDDPMLDRPLQAASDFSAGWGDMLSFNITSLIRDALGTNQEVRTCSWWYTGGEVFGFVNSLFLGGSGVFNGGARSVFYSGEGALKIAMANKGLGIVLAETIGGRVLNFAERQLFRVFGKRLPNFVWKIASAFFAANAKGEVQVFLRNPSVRGIWNTVEKPILQFFKNTTIVLR